METRELPSYSLRYSKRAKNMQLKICKINGLEVVVPIKKKKYDPTKFLLENKNWIKKHWNAILKAQQFKNKSIELPQSIHLTYLQQSWNIIYIEELHKKQLRMRVNPHTKTLTLIGLINQTLVKKILLKWLRSYGHEQFTLSLQKLTKKTGLSYNKLFIRRQNSLWGSCNSSKNISLNLNLLFLPTNVSDYILLHELCHTKYLNHSKKFWLLVEKHDSNYHQHKNVLSNVEEYIPDWLMYDIK